MTKKDYSNWTKEELIRELEKFKKQKKYGIVWEDKPEQVALMCKEKLPVLTEVKEKEIKTDKNKPTNILIEGDNYHALSVLNYTHKGKIDVIYIDPPYNTGNEGFMYNDKIVDKEDAYRHSKWLSFMEKRLCLAKNLLSDKGVIFISIDDNEVAQLKLLCDEIFGEDNFVANIIWEKKYSPANDSKYLSDTHDYVLIYKKKNWEVNLLERTYEMNARYKNIDNDPRGPWKPGGFSVKTYSKNYDYPIKTPSGKIVYPPSGSCWQTSKERFKELLKDNRIWFGVKGDAKPQIKQFLSEVKQGFVPKTLWTKEESGHNQLAMNLLKDILGKKAQVFGTPKPIKLIKRILKISSKSKNSIILDFFAGSGTTGHAVLELNKEDGGNRKFILCTNNENNICTDICYPRIKKVIEGYKNLKGEWVEGLGGNLKYFKTDFISKSNVSDDTKYQLVQRSTEMICIKENTFNKVVDRKFIKIFKNSHYYTAILFHLDYFNQFKKELKKLDKEMHIYVFSLTNDTYDEDFRDLKQKYELCPIPESILAVYKKIFKN